MKINQMLLVLSIMFFVFFDMFSTLIAYNYLSTFEYEKSFFLKLAFKIGGIYGFILLKSFVGIIALYLIYILTNNKTLKKFENIGRGILVGSSLSGIYVGCSNINIIINNSSYWLFGLDSGTIAVLLIFLTPLMFIMLDKTNNIVNIFNNKNI